jgi:hypothetical protein
VNRREWLVRTGGACAALVLGAPARADEVPYVQTPQNVVDAMLEIAGVRATDYLIDLGSGDGRIVITAAQRYGTRGLGIDYDAYLVDESTRRARAAGVADRASFVQQDIFEADLSRATVVTMYLLPAVNLALRPRLLATLKPGTRLVSHDWDMGDWEPDAKAEVLAPDKPVGLLKQSTVYLWIVPAQAAGQWRTRLPLPGGFAEATLALEQRFQVLEGVARIGAHELPVEEALVRGPHVFFGVGEGPERLRFQGRVFADRMVGRVTTADERTHAWRAVRAP